MKTLLSQPPSPALPLHLDRLHMDENRSLFIVRDDLLPAGTKQRAILPLLRDLRRDGVTHLTYASPFAGFAQIALAYGCQSLGISCTIFSERDPQQAGMQPHPFTVQAMRYNAEIILVESLSAAEERAAAMAASGKAHKIPLGFQCREFQKHFQLAVIDSLAEIQGRLGFVPRRAWLPVGSATLAHAFHEATPSSTELHCVDVHVLPESDLRIQRLRTLSRVHYYSARETFAEQALHRAPVPSNAHYDAKVWGFAAAHAQNGDLWWNVAR